MVPSSKVTLKRKQTTNAEPRLSQMSTGRLPGCVRWRSANANDKVKNLQNGIQAVLGGSDEENDQKESRS